jgi:hypothetical protein
VTTIDVEALEQALRAAEAELDAANTKAELNAAAKRLARARTALKAAERARLRAAPPAGRPRARTGREPRPK